jgi:hypothetical protein
MEPKLRVFYISSSKGTSVSMKVFSAKKVFVWLSWGMVFLVVLEFCVRFEDLIKWDAPFFGPYSHEILWQPTAWGNGGRPNARFEKWKINSHGFRSGEIGQSKPTYKIRILVMGASETFGLYESPGHDFPELLDKDLNGIFPNCYNVINTGFPGMSLPRMCQFFEKVVKTLQPDVVVVYPSPQFYLDMKVPSEKTFANFNFLERNEERKFEPRLKRKLKIVLKKILPPSLQTLIRRLIIEYTRNQLGIREAWERPPPKRLAAFQRHLERLVQEIKAMGCQVILATHANRFGTCLDGVNVFHMYAWILYYPSVTPLGMLKMEESANDMIRKVAAKYRVSVADLADILSGRSENFADFSHFTDEGSRKVAEVLSKAIINLISPEHNGVCH